MPDEGGAVDFERHTLRGWPRRALRVVILGFLRLVVKLRLQHVERAPLTGGVLVVSNHLHNVDPILVDAAFPRPLHFMAKKELFAIPVVRTLLPIVGAFPVDRGRADRTAIKRAQALLAQSIAVGIFPEGTRSVTRSLQKAHPGAGLLALSGCPVQPVVVTGSERLPLNGAKAKLAAGAAWPDSGHAGVRILFGEPFTVPASIDGRRVGADQAAEIIMIEIARLLPPDYRGVYAEALASEAIRRELPFSGC